MTRTNIVLDELLIGKARRLTGLKTIRAIVDHALKELIRHRRQKDLLKLSGSVQWEGRLSDSRHERKFGV